MKYFYLNKTNNITLYKLTLSTTDDFVLPKTPLQSTKKYFTFSSTSFIHITTQVIFRGVTILKLRPKLRHINEATYKW